jgi:integrase
MEEIPMTPDPLTRTVKVQVRHSPDCKHKNRGPEFKGCQCPKVLRVYEGGGAGANRRISAKTRSWEKAEEFAREYRDSFDPRLQKLKQLESEKERQQVRIEEAVALFTADMVTRLGDYGTVSMSRSLFGHVDPETKAIKKNGNLFDWIDSLPAPQRPTFISEFSPALVTAWRSAWKFKSDLTAAQRWSMVKGFFNFCESQGWIQDSPARKLKRLNVKKGNRTAIFDDAQYDAILGAVAQNDPENVPAITRKGWQQRLTTFIELSRWSGMALSDAVQFRPDLVDAEGVLRYRRQKTSELATVQLPERVIVLLREIPLEKDSVGIDQPFRTNAKRASDTATWARRLQEIFKLAGITEVHTGSGKTRRPHAHMLRDTFAVWNLRHGASIYAVAKMLGHSDPTTTAKAYLPWVKELESATLSEGRKALAQGMPKPGKPGKVVKIVNI